MGDGSKSRQIGKVRYQSTALLVFVSLIGGCLTLKNKSTKKSTSVKEIVDLGPKQHSASSQFWDYWGDGKAEISTYEGKIRRYGKLRDVRKISIYVTEPMNRQSWIKDNDAKDKNRVNVLKLNQLTEFQTGVYDYSLMKSLFSPVAKYPRVRFQPVKLNFTSQDWCGHLYHGLWVGQKRIKEVRHSYFAGEGDMNRARQIPERVLFQDALWIQLRELDGEFKDGKNWKGKIIPRLWDARNHRPLEAVSAQISRADETYNGRKVTRFRLTYNDTTVTYDVSKSYPHRIIHWRHSNGSELQLKAHERLPYWKLNHPDGRKHRKELGLPTKMLYHNPTDQQ